MAFAGNLLEWTAIANRPSRVGSRFSSKSPEEHVPSMSATTILVQALKISRRRMLGSVRDFTPAEFSHQPAADLRSCRQIFGAAVVADREVMRYLDLVILPSPDEFDAQHAHWETGNEIKTHLHGSSPEIFTTHRDALILATKLLVPSQFDTPIIPEDHLDEDAVFRFKTVGEMIAAAAAFTHFLAGEISIIRLALGKPWETDPTIDHRKG